MKVMVDFQVKSGGDRIKRQGWRHLPANADVASLLDNIGSLRGLVEMLGVTNDTLKLLSLVEMRHVTPLSEGLMRGS